MITREKNTNHCMMKELSIVCKYETSILSRSKEAFDKVENSLCPFKTMLWKDLCDMNNIELC